MLFKIKIVATKMGNKTKPIGVRFDEDILEGLKKANLAHNPQSALRFLERYYILNETIDNKDNQEHNHSVPTSKIIGEPKEGSMAFFKKHGAMTFLEK